MRHRLLSIARWVWGHKLIAGGVILAGLIGLVVLTVQTSTPLFCSSCHEMRYEYRTWQESSHHTKSCEVCHYHTGLIGMMRTKIQGTREAVLHFTKRPTQSEIGPGMAEVPSSRCLKCHPPAKLPTEITYHLLRHTHRRHLDRGAQCTDCHSNLVHGGKAPFKNTPSMSSCLKCHDGKKAPNRCGLCHVQLGEIRPALYNPAWVTRHKENIAVTGKENCVRCHGQDFCQSCHKIARPHADNWVTAHQKLKPTEVKACATCHPPRGDLPQADFCTECHTARRAHGPNWIQDHPQQFQKEPDACGHCHQQEFCKDCHDIYMPHEPGWLEKHPQGARANRDRCRTCHTDEFCQNCHTHGRPPSHTKDWPQTHKITAKQSAEGCRYCHTLNFCQSCHRKHPPASHETGDWIRTHGGPGLTDRKDCQACHDASYCSSCHRGITMPHPPDWVRIHRNSGISESACRACHATEFCNTCHRGSKPTSHTGAWPRAHGAAAARSRTECLRCHGAEFCNVCHRIPMPHPKDIRTSHPALASGPNGRYCGLCHTTDQCAQCHAHNPPASHRTPQWPKQHGATQGADGRCALCHGARTCEVCHGLPMPHPDDWLMGPHGKTAEKTPQLCAKCHKPKACQSCHESTPPDSHTKKDFKQKHGADLKAEPFCALCHGRDAKKGWTACETCHHGVKMPHPDDYAMHHKGPASFDKNGPCLACHKIDDCKVCHSNSP